MSDLFKGSCACGSVRFETSGPLRAIVYCHCSQCRKQSGHFYAATAVPLDSLTVFGGDAISWYRSSADAQRGFCATCGSALFWKRDDRPCISVLAGSFDGDPPLVGSNHIHVSGKGTYYTLDDGLPQSPE